MASLLSPRRTNLSSRRTDSDIVLRATEAQSDRPSPGRDQAELPRFSWVLAAAGGAWVAALCGWVVVTGVTVLGWLTAGSQTIGAALGVGTQLWLLANGVGTQLGSIRLTLVPWGATLFVAYLLYRLAAFAARQVRGPALSGAAAVSVLMLLAYAAPVAVASLLTRGSVPTLRGLVGVGVVLALAAWWGSCSGLGWTPTRSWPEWCRALPRAIGGAQLAMAASGAAALVVGLVLHFNRVLALTDGLHTGVVGGIALWLVQLAFVPNAVVWAGSYVLGAGFSLGSGSVVALAATEHGLLPSVPLLGALPGAGAGTQTGLWWLAAGVLAGGSAAWVMVRARPAARADRTCLVGGLSGVLGGLGFVALAWASGGDLGSVRLAGLGPRLLPLLMLSVTTMGLAGMVVGLALGLFRHPRD
jgi:hypothetical protein